MADTREVTAVLWLIKIHELQSFHILSNKHIFILQGMNINESTLQSLSRCLAISPPASLYQKLFLEVSGLERDFYTYGRASDTKNGYRVSRTADTECRADAS